MSIVSDLKEQYRTGGAGVKLIFANIVVFVIVRLMDFLSYVSDLGSAEALHWLAMPMQVADFVTKPWTLVTYQFVHYDFVHIAFNMLCLHWFGRLFSHLIGERLLLRTYLLGGIVGAVLCLVIQAFSHSVGILLGASGAVLALLFAVAVFEPEYRVNIVFVGNIRLKYYALIFVAIDILSIAAWNNVGGHVAHLGGALLGVALGLWWKRNGVPQLKAENAYQPHRAKMKVVYGDKQCDIDYNTQKQARSQEVDRILEKIKLSGYDSLSKHERQTLFDESQK